MLLDQVVFISVHKHSFRRSSFPHVVFRICIGVKKTGQPFVELSHPIPVIRVRDEVVVFIRIISKVRELYT